MAGEERPRIEVPGHDEVERALDLVRGCPDLLALHDVGGRYLYASPAAREVLGYEPEELVGLDGYALMHPDDVEAIQEVHDDMMIAPSGYVLRGRCRHKDGSWVWCESTIRMVYDPRTGQPDHGVSSTRRLQETEEARARVFLVESEERREDLDPAERSRRPGASEHSERSERTGSPGASERPGRPHGSQEPESAEQEERGRGEKGRRGSG